MNGWEGALGGFAESLADAQLAESTRVGYLRHLNALAAWASVGPWDLSTSDLTRWVDGQQWSQSTRNKVVHSLRKFYGWAVAQGHLEWAPTAGLGAFTARRRGPDPATLPQAWREPVEAFCAWLAGTGHSPGTIGQWVHRLRMLAAVAADPWSVSTQQLAQLLSRPDWAPQTKRSSRTAVQVFYRWAVTVGRLEASPAESLPPIRCPRSLPRPTPAAAIAQALAAADDRTRLMLMLAGLAGLRRAEIATLHTSQVSDGRIVVIGKGGHHRMVPLHPDLEAELRVELHRRREGRHGSGWSGRFVSEDGYLFPSDKDPGPITPAHLGKVVSRVLPGRWTTHSLRHYFATQAYAGQRDLLAVQQLLGHAKPETTAVYAQVPDGALLNAVAGIRLT